MTSPHIAIITGLGKPHMYPVIGLCPELVKRGWRVTYATDAQHAALVRQVGAEPVPFEPPQSKMSPGETATSKLPLCDSDWWLMYARSVYPTLLDAAAAMVDQLVEFYQDSPPDVLLYDRIAFGGRIIAKRIGCQAIQIYPHFAPCGNSLLRVNDICCTPQPMMEFASHLTQFLASYGIEDNDSLWHVDDFNIYFIPREFQYFASSFDHRSCFVGPCLDRPIQNLWINKANGLPIILVSDTTGSMDGAYFSTFVDALAGGDYYVILSVSEQMPIDALPALPRNFEVNQKASHLEILPHTSLLICQAGTGSTLEAIYHGVPVIGIPLTPFHEEVAYRLVELGLGIRISRQAISPDVIRDSVKRVLGDSALLASVQNMKEVFRRSGGATKAADEIEQFLQTRRGS